MRHPWECDDGARDQSRKRANGGNDGAAIHAIRQPADGVLGHCGGENADRHESRNLGRRQAIEPCVHGAHRKDGGGNQARYGDAHDAER